MTYSVKTLILPLLMIVGAYSLCVLPASAAWNQPSCNPDSVDPTDPTCNVSAPLNVSSSAQTKSGQLTIQNTLNAGSLNVTNTYGGNGNIVITTSSGKSLNITHNDGVQSAISIATNSTQPGIGLTQSGSGQGISITSVAGQTINASNNSATNPTGNFSNSSSASGLTASNNSSSSATISASNSNASAFGAVRACMGSTNCAVLGSSTYAGNFDGQTSVGVSGVRVSTNPAFSVYSSGAIGAVFDNTNAAGVGISITQTGNTSKGISITDNGNAATGVDITMNGTTGTGIAVNTTGGIGGSFISTSASLSSVLAQNVSGGIGVTADTTSGNALFATSTTGTTISATATTGTAGSFSAGTASGNVVTIQNTSTGSGLAVSTGGVAVSSIPVPSGWPIAGGFGIRSTTATSYGVIGYSTAATGYGVGVYGRAVDDYGVVAYSDNDYGLFANSQAAASYGSASCNTMTANCAYLGGGTYSGNFAGKTYTSTSASATAVAQIYNTNITGPNYGFGLTVRTMTGSLTALTANQGTAIEGQAYNGFGVLAYSQNGASGLYAENGRATGGVGGHMVANGSASKAVYGENLYAGTAASYGGYFTSSSDASTALYVENLNAASGTVKYGIQASATTPSGVAIQGTSLYGKAGEFISTAGGTGIYVNGQGSTAGIQVSVNDFDPAITVGVGTVASTGGFKGGQFYSNENAGTGVMPNVLPSYSKYTSVGSGYNVSDMIFDGSQLWISASGSGASAGIVESFDTKNFQIINDYGTGLLNTHTRPLFAEGFVKSGDNRDIWVFIRSSNSYFTIDRYDGTTTSSTLSGVDATSGYPRSSAYDGASIWIGTSKAILEYVSAGSAFTRVSGIGNIIDIIYADGYIWGLDSTNDVVHKVDTSTYADTQITVGSDPTSLIYDGSHVWVANYTSNTLTRINPSSNATESYSISSLGTGPNSITFDGANIWIGFESAGVGYFSIADEAVGESDILCGACAGASSIDRVIFDGTYVWALDDAGDLFQVPTGSGFGDGDAIIKKGILMYNTSGTVYCSYINGGGTWTTSTTLTQCQ